MSIIQAGQRQVLLSMNSNHCQLHEHEERETQASRQVSRRAEHNTQVSDLNILLLNSRQGWYFHLPHR